MNRSSVHLVRALSASASWRRSCPFSSSSSIPFHFKSKFSTIRSSPYHTPLSLRAMATSSSNSILAQSDDIEKLTEQQVEERYRPYRISRSNSTEDAADWVDDLELDTVSDMSRQLRPRRLRFLVLYGSLRERSFSRLMAYEAARILDRLGADVRVFDPRGLPVKDDVQHEHPKVQELRALSQWSDGHFWSSPEQHGNLTAVFKNQIDWIPLSTGSVRPTQGRTLGIAQINGGSQSFNTVNSLRILGRWMRMFTIPNQSSLPKAWTQFTSSDRLMPSDNRDRLVDVCEELVKVTILLLPHFNLLGDRHSERKEKIAHGKLRTQAEKENAAKAAKEAADSVVKDVANDAK